MREPDLSLVSWRKSSYSNGTGGSCVEIAVLPTASGSPPQIAVRDSKDPYGPHLTFTTRHWRALTASIKAGQLTHP